MARVQRVTRFDDAIFDSAIFDTEPEDLSWIRNRRKRRKVIDYEMAIMKNVGR